MIDRFHDPTELKEGMKMKKHHKDTFEQELEKIEEIIENLEPGEETTPGDIMAKANVKNRTSALNEATIMLIRKYGIRK